MEIRDNDRIFVSSSSMSGSVNLAWAVADSGIFSRADEPSYDGELLIHEKEGLATIKLWDGDGDRDEYEPYVVVIDPQRRSGSYLTIYLTEDQPPNPDAPIVWASARAEATA